MLRSKRMNPAAGRGTFGIIGALTPIEIRWMAEKTYQFKGFILNPKARTLHHEGQPVHVQPQTYDAIVYLVEHQGRLVTRKELMDRLWPGVVVTENALSRTIREVRKALGGKQFVETLPRVGYRFVPPVESRTLEPITPRAARKTAFVTAGIAGLALVVALAFLMLGPSPKPAPPANTVAVLPFNNGTGNPDEDVFSAALSEGVLNDLATVSSLSVAARASAFGLASVGQVPERIADRLNSYYVLLGDVRERGTKLRVDVRLIDYNGNDLWQRTFDQPFDEVFMIQRSIVDDVITTILPQIGPQPPRARGTDDSEAYLAFLTGREHLHRRGEGWIEKARTNFESAIIHDAAFPAAYAGLAMAQALSMSYGGDVMELASAELNVSRALTLAPELPEAHAARGLLLEIQRDYMAAESALRLSLAYDPKLVQAYNWLHLTLKEQDRFDESRRVLLRGLEIDPLNPILNENLGHVYASAGNYEATKNQWLRLRDTPDGRTSVYANLTNLELEFGRAMEALGWARRFMEETADSVEAIAALRRVYRYVGLGEVFAQRYGDPTVDHWDEKSATKECMSFMSLGDYAAAVNFIQVVLDTNAALPPEYLRLAGHLKVLANQTVDGLELFEQANTDRQVAAQHLLDLDHLQSLAHAYAEMGNKAQANALLDSMGDRLAYLRSANMIGGPGASVIEARWHAMRGNHSRALAALAESVRAGYLDAGHLGADPRWGNLREDPMFVDIVQQLATRIAGYRQQIIEAEGLHDFVSASL